MKGAGLAVFIWKLEDGGLAEADNMAAYKRLVQELGRLPDHVECWRNLGGDRTQIGEYKRGPVNVITRGEMAAKV